MCLSRTRDPPCLRIVAIGGQNHKQRVWKSISEPPMLSKQHLWFGIHAPLAKGRLWSWGVGLWFPGGGSVNVCLLGGGWPLWCWVGVVVVKVGWGWVALFFQGQSWGLSWWVDLCACWREGVGADVWKPKETEYCGCEASRGLWESDVTWKLLMNWKMALAASENA